MALNTIIATCVIILHPISMITYVTKETKVDDAAVYHQALEAFLGIFCPFWHWWKGCCEKRCCDEDGIASAASENFNCHVLMQTIPGTWRPIGLFSNLLFSNHLLGPPNEVPKPKAHSYSPIGGQMQGVGR